MRKALRFIVIAFALVAGTAAFVTDHPDLGFAYEDGDHKGA